MNKSGVRCAAGFGRDRFGSKREYLSASRMSAHRVRTLARENGMCLDAMHRRGNENDPLNSREPATSRQSSTPANCEIYQQKRCTCIQGRCLDEKQSATDYATASTMRMSRSAALPSTFNAA